MLFSSVVKLFKKGSVCVTGQRGSGKDMLTANVIARRAFDYVSNIDYQCSDSTYHELDYNHLMLGGLTYRDLVSGNFRKFRYLYPEKADIYISDIGVFFPSQYCNECNKYFAPIPLFLALSRQIANCNVHLNVQNLNRAWDKFREQSDIYITCNSCKVIGSWVFQKITLYDKAESCQARVKPCRVSGSLFPSASAQIKIYKDQFYNSHGTVESHWLIYKNKSKYDTRHFKSLLIEEDQQ